MKAARRPAITGLLAVALASLTTGVTEVQAGHKVKTLTLFVDLDVPDSFAFAEAGGDPSQGAFSVEGAIFDPDDPMFDPGDPPGGAPQIGTFEGWGWIVFDEAGEVVVKEKASQVYTIGVDHDGDGIADTGVDVIGGPAPELGAIMTQGLEFGGELGLLAVVGGTDDFSNVGGDAAMTFTDGGFDVVFEFTRRSFLGSRAR